MMDSQPTPAHHAPAPPRPMNTHRRLMRVIVPLVSIAFLLMWAAFVRYNDAVQETAVQTSQQSETQVLSRFTRDALTNAARDARQLAGNRNLRAFASQTLIDVGGSSIDPYQQAVLSDFTSLLDQHPCEYLAIRYITYTGSVWSEATNYDCNMPLIDTGVRIDAFNGDAGVQNALRAALLGSVVAGNAELRRPQSGAESSRQSVIARLNSPVAAQNDEGNIAGVLQIEFAIEPLLNLLGEEGERVASVTGGRRVLLVDTENRLLVDTGDANFDLTRSLALAAPTGLESALPEAAALLSEQGVPTDGISISRGDFHFAVMDISIADNETPVWRLILADDARLASLGDTGQIVTAFLAAFGAAAGVCLLLNVLLARALRPLERAAQTAQQLFAGDMGLGAMPSGAMPSGTGAAALSGAGRGDSSRADPDADDPTSAIVTGFRAIQGEVLKLRTDLDREATRYARNLDIAARIGRETATLDDTDALLNRAMDLICREYGFYHAQVFLIDDVGRNAVLVYSFGQAGEELLRRNHKLVVGSPSVIGRVTATGEPTIVNDTQAAGTAHRFNPLLPRTRAEMALPLVVGMRVIGALDVQSLEPDVFREDEVRVFQLLADQIAIALQNARLAGEAQDRLAQIDQLNRQLTRMAWGDTAAREKVEDVYRYDLMNIEQLAAGSGHIPGVADDAGRDITLAYLDDPQLEQVNAQQIRIPITVRGAVIGALDAQADTGQEFTPGDAAIVRAVADRVALAVESARLYEETQISLNETSTLYQLSRYLNEASNLDEIIQALIISVMPDAIGGQIAMFDEYIEMVGPNWTEIIAEWALDDVGMPRASRLRGTQFQLRAHATLTEMAANVIYTVSDIAALDPDLRELLADTGGQSFVFIPFSVRGSYRGIIFVNLPMQRAFSEREKHLYSALIDQAGVAIDNRMLLEQNAVALTRIERLYSSSRQINIAQSAFDLVRAAVNSDEGAQHDYFLGLVEGAGDPLDWRDSLRIVAYSRGEEVIGDTRLFPFDLALDSPLRSREPIVAAGEVDSPLSVILRAYGRGFGAAFPLYSANQPIALFIIASEGAHDLNEDEFDIYRALTGQMSTVLQNRTLLEQTEQDRERLSSILETLPAGVLVLDARTLIPVQANEEMQALFGQPIAMDVPFTSARYGLTRVDTQQVYPDAELPMVAALGGDANAQADDVALIDVSGQIVNLLVNAAPIYDAQGIVNAVVAAFQDVTILRSLENTLQQNLDNTISLYETTRALIEAEETEDVIDQLVNRLGQQDVIEVQVALLDEERGGTMVVRALSGYTGAYNLPDEILGASEVQAANLSENARLTAPARQLLGARGAAAYVTIPLRSRANAYVPLGWLVILYPREQEFTVERVQYLTTLGDSAAVALDNRALFRGTEQALQETATLYSATTTISRSRDLESLSAALQIGFNSLQPDVYAAYLLSEERGLIELLNTNMDGAPVDFSRMIAEHDLLVTGALTIDDLRAVREPTPFIRDLLATDTLNAISVVPLRAKGLPRGLLFVGYHLAHRGTPGEARYLSAMGESASVVADNIVLFGEVQNTLRETATLYMTSRRMSDATSSNDILDSIVTNLQGRPIALAFMIQLETSGGWDAPDVRADVTASWTPESLDFDLSGFNISPTQFPLWRLLSVPEVTVIDDIEELDVDLEDLERASLHSFDMRSVAILPLRFGGRAGGVIVFGSPEPYAHTERDLRIYTALAEQASLRIEASRLLAQTERRARQLTTSAEVSQIASSILQIDELLPRLVDLIRDAFSYDHVQIFLMDDEDDFAVLRASTGEAGQTLLALAHKLQRGSQSIIGQVTATGKPTIAADTANTGIVHRPNPHLPQTRSEMAIPLILQGRTIGALDVQSNQPNAYDSDDVTTLTTLATQIAVAIENARLYQQSLERASEMTFLFSVTTTAASANTTGEALQNVANELAETLDALSVSIYLPQQVVVTPSARYDTDADADDDSVRMMTLLRPSALAGANAAAQPISELMDIRLDDRNNLIASIANTRRPLIIADIAHEATYLPVTADARSAIIVPLTSGAQIIGLIVMESAQLGAYNANTLSLLLTLSGTLAAVVQNQNLLETLQNTNDQLRELDRLKSDFLANMSHELRTPLNSIIGFSRVILKGIDGPLTEMQEQDLSTIYNSGLHLLNLINDILDQAKIAAGKMDLQADYFESKNVIDGVRSIGIGLIKDKPVEMRVNLASGLPRVFGDEFRTRQVLLNLISNAAKFTREGLIIIDAYPVVRDGHTMLRIDVTDSGIGIAEQDMPSLFEAFRQVDSSLTRVVGGTGLGLPIAKSLTEMQGGIMLVQSQVNVGSTFSILLPTEPGLAPSLNKADDEDTPTGSAELQAPTATTPKKQTGMLNPDIATAAEAAQSASRSDASGGKDSGAKEDTNIFARNARSKNLAGPPKRATTDLNLMRPPMTQKRQILLIEDNPDMVDQLRRGLGREGFDIFSASIPLEAEAMASGLHPTLLIMDVNFSNGAGWDILKRLKAREDTVDIPVVIVSLSPETERALAEGAFRFLRRPFTPDELVAAVREAEHESRVQRILIIDDQAESVRLLQQMLEVTGQYRIFAASSGMEGISMVARRRPDLILLDLRMPELDGFGVIAELRDNPETAHIPIVVVTSEALTLDEQARLSAHQVIYKTDLSADRSRPLIDGVKDHLEHGMGD